MMPPAAARAASVEPREICILSHVTIGVSDFERAMAFYTPLMAALGYPQKFREPEVPWAGWMPADAARPLFIVGRPFDGASAQSGNGQMIALLAGTRALVDEAHKIALREGGRDEGGPGPRPHYHADYYGAYFRDPDGNKLCVCCHAAV